MSFCALTPWGERCAENRTERAGVCGFSDKEQAKALVFTAARRRSEKPHTHQPRMRISTHRSARNSVDFRFHQTLAEAWKAFVHKNLALTTRQVVRAFLCVAQASQRQRHRGQRHGSSLCLVDIRQRATQRKPPWQHAMHRACKRSRFLRRKTPSGASPVGCSSALPCSPSQ